MTTASSVQAGLSALQRTHEVYRKARERAAGPCTPNAPSMESSGPPGTPVEEDEFTALPAGRTPRGASVREAAERDLAESVRKLRAVQATKDDGRASEYWCGLKIEPSDEFFARGATDLAFMSTTKCDRKTAERAVSTDGANASVCMRLQLTQAQCGADISWLSCFPAEAEHVYPPGTYLEPKPDRGGARMPGALRIVEGVVHIKDHNLEYLVPASPGIDNEAPKGK